MIKLTKDQFEAIEWRAPARGSSQVAGVAWVGMLRDQELAALMPEGFIDPDRGVAESRSENLGREAGALLVKFTSGGVYVYEDVAEAQAQELLDSESAGRYLNQRIKPKRRYERVEVVG